MLKMLKTDAKVKDLHEKILNGGMKKSALLTWLEHYRYKWWNKGFDDGYAEAIRKGKTCE